MFKITPPRSENVAKYFGILFVVFLLSCAYMRGYQAGMCSTSLASTCGADVPEPVELSKLLYCNADSIAYYSAIAAREDNPRALFIVGMAAHLRAADPNYPSDVVTVPLSEADHYLLRAAELGYPDAIQYIRCLDYHRRWHHFVPQNCK